MNNFGVIELASTRTVHAPGWAYVPDTGINPSLAAQPKNRKRARNATNSKLTASDLTARQEAKVRKELELLDRDNPKDVVIPIPNPQSGSRAAQNKHTPNIRKILQSQKTFANHLDDYQAQLALAEANPVVTAAQTDTPAVSFTAPATGRRVSAAATGGARGKKGRDSAAAKKKKTQKVEPSEMDITMTEAPPAGPSEPDPKDDDHNEAAGEGDDGDAKTDQQEAQSGAHSDATPLAMSYPADGTILPAYCRPPPRPHPLDNDPLLVSALPPFPTDEELRALMTAPPLGYLEARATWGDEGDSGCWSQRYPPRQFCAVCGYWGRVGCIKCGVRLCALDCLEVHREECITRYGL